KIRIVEGRHPLIDKQKVVPITVELGGENLMLLVTGPNTGGKTVALKTVGLFALMAQTGMYIPALTAELPVFNAIYADIGDEQSIEQSLSTFSSHMTNIINVLQTVREGDLVLIDEICAGTDPNEGAAWAMSILEDVFEHKILTMVTTHYSELKTFAYGHNGMQNASVEFDVESLRPTYRLLMGVPGNSNAFNISRRLGLDDIIVNRAGKMLNEEHTHMEKVLQDLDIKRRGYEEGKSEVEKIKFEAEMLRNQLAYQKKEFLKYRDDMLRRAREKADDIYRESRREAEGIIKELRSHKNVVDTKVLQEIAERARQTLNKQLSGDNPVPEGTKLTNATAKVGQKVFVTTLGKNGYVISLNSSDITVRVGILKMNVLPEQCILVANQPVSVVLKKEKSHNLSSSHKLFEEKSSGSKQDVDLRGWMVEEAVVVVGKGIDDACLAGVGRLRIIHGKGTGALKAGIVPYLIKHNMVVGVQEAASEEGGAGVTVINLK
ncbi:MAG: Smr/MutS family protein, partial [Acidaminococcaceae bacterium]|nr:Smr/MutS family protein [Acidaminococcaceae bacterium]